MREKLVEKYSPPLQRRGGRDIKKDNAQPPFDGADGVVATPKRLCERPPRLRRLGCFATFS